MPTGPTAGDSVSGGNGRHVVGDVTVESIDTVAHAGHVDRRSGVGRTRLFRGELHLIVHADLPGITDEQFEQLADEARRLCAISKILRVPITLGAARVAVTITTSAQHAPRESH
jgi:organic hydroperoxide reductase OsmC/OhrA